MGGAFISNLEFWNIGFKLHSLIIPYLKEIFLNSNLEILIDWNNLVYSIRLDRSNRWSHTNNNAGGLHWSELEGPTDIVLSVDQD